MGRGRRAQPRAEREEFRRTAETGRISEGAEGPAGRDTGPDAQGQRGDLRLRDGQVDHPQAGRPVGAVHQPGNGEGAEPVHPADADKQHRHDHAQQHAAHQDVQDHTLHQCEDERRGASDQAAGDREADH